MSSTAQELDHLIGKEYKEGFVTDIEAETFDPGLDEDVIRRLSAIKQEPEWLLAWRLEAFRHWQTMVGPDWAKLDVPPIDYQALSYYSAPKSKKDGPKSLDEVDPKLLETYEKLGIPLEEQKVLAGVEVDAVNLPGRSHPRRPCASWCAARLQPSSWKVLAGVGVDAVNLP